MEAKNVTDLKADAKEMAKFNLEQARDALSKLPVMGPILWLYARDPQRKYMFLGDTDWLVLPPVILDQCRLFTKNGIPFSFVAWARVNDDIDARLRAGMPKLAPHEWKSGPHIWLTDIVAPFGGADEIVKNLQTNTLSGETLHALLPDPAREGALSVREWAPLATPPGEAAH